MRPCRKYNHVGSDKWLFINMICARYLTITFFVASRYLVLANMLMESEVNPFDGQEAKPYAFELYLLPLKL